MIAPRELIILRSDNTYFWQWKEHPNSRFSEAAYQGAIRLLDIRGRVGTEMLSPKTDYAAYLVFKLAAMTCRLESANSTIRFVNYESEIGTYRQANTMKFPTILPKMRGDGWMEVELGYFNSKEGSDGPVEARLLKIKRIDYKGGLIVEGIEFRPKKKLEYKSSSVADLGFYVLQSFSLDNKTGKKYFMVAPKELAFSWDHTSRYWGLSYYPESRFSEVAYFPGFRWLDIRGKISSQMLSKQTKYTVYLVFKLAPNAFDGLEIGTSVVRFINRGAEERRKVRRIGLLDSQRRVDGRMEIEMGKFFNDAGEDGDVEARLMEIGIGSLLVQGVEFRPE